MRNTLLALLITLLSASSTLAEPPSGQKPRKSANPDRLLPFKPAGSSSACAAYGPGFVEVEGTGTCVKVGGAVSIEAGSTSHGGRR